jgi:hypothetical protein
MYSPLWIGLGGCKRKKTSADLLESRGLVRVRRRGLLHRFPGRAREKYAQPAAKLLQIPQEEIAREKTERLRPDLLR